MAIYDVGDEVRLTCTFSVSGVNTDPSAVTLLVSDPSANVTTYTYAADITKSATGIYYYDVGVDEAGGWEYRWAGTGTATGAEEARFNVKAQRVSA